MVLFKGKKKGMIHTMDIEWRHIREVFFPKDFNEKYSYLGYIYVNEEGGYFEALLPLILVMDYYAKPRWCPRWVLRFLHLFGNDHSVVRVRNRWMHDLHRKLTKGIFMVDWKTKWQWYDLRISIYGNKTLQDLADNIEVCFYNKGRKEDVLKTLKQIPSLEGKYETYWELSRLEALYNNYEDEKNSNVQEPV